MCADYLLIGKVIPKSAPVFDSQHASAERPGKSVPAQLTGHVHQPLVNPMAPMAAATARADRCSQVRRISRTRRQIPGEIRTLGWDEVTTPDRNQGSLLHESRPGKQNKTQAGPIHSGRRASPGTSVTDRNNFGESTSGRAGSLPVSGNVGKKQSIAPPPLRLPLPPRLQTGEVAKVRGRTGASRWNWGGGI